MSSTEHFQTLFAYHTSTYNHLLDCAEQLSEADYKQHPGYGIGSIHDILFHVLYWEHRWRIGIETGKSSGGLRSRSYSSLGAIRKGIALEQSEWQRVIKTFDSSTLDQSCTINTTQFQIWRILQHLILHGMQHHSEAAALLTAKGQSPGGIDFIWYNG